MHPKLIKLIQKIEKVVTEKEQLARSPQPWFPMPESNVLEGLNLEEAQDRFDKILYSFFITCHCKSSYRVLNTTSSEKKYKELTKNYGKNSLDASSGQFMISRYYPADYKLALKLSRTGAEGGIHQVLNTLFDGLTSVWIQDSIDELVKITWGDISGEWLEHKDGTKIEHRAKLYGSQEKRMAYVESYKKHYAPFLPREYLEEELVMSWISFDKTLARHHILMKRMKKIIQ